MDKETEKQRTNKISIVRRIIQACFLGLFIFLFIQASYTSLSTPSSNFFLRFDPLSGIFSLSNSWSFSTFALFWPAWTVLFLSMIGKRFFCGWICPLGTCFDAAGALKPKKLQYSKPSGKEMKKLLEDQKAGIPAKRKIRIKYILLLIVVALFFAGINLMYISSPLVIMNRALYLISVIQIPIVFLILILIAFFYRTRFWCEDLCPLGAMFSLFSMAGSKLGTRFNLLSVVKNHENCIECGACYRECSFGVSEPYLKEDSGKLMSADCTGCGECIRACPASDALVMKKFGITVSRSTGNARRKSPPAPAPEQKANAATSGKLAVSRKEFIESVGVGAVMMAGYGIGLRNYTDPILRMPGAQNESEFLAMCERCGECMMVCPTGCIKPMGIEDGFQKLWTPRFQPREACCTFDQCDQACATACPYQAIKKEKPEDVKIGVAHINRHTCIAYKGNVCLACKERCRFNAIEIDDRKRPIVKTLECTGCGACQQTCPTNPESIAVLPIGVEPSWSTTDGEGGRGKNR